MSWWWWYDSNHNMETTITTTTNIIIIMIGYWYRIYWYEFIIECMMDVVDFPVLCRRRFIVWKKYLLLRYWSLLGTYIPPNKKLLFVFVFVRCLVCRFDDDVLLLLLCLLLLVCNGKIVSSWSLWFLGLLCPFRVVVVVVLDDCEWWWWCCPARLRNTSDIGGGIFR